MDLAGSVTQHAVDPRRNRACKLVHDGRRGDPVWERVTTGEEVSDS